MTEAERIAAINRETTLDGIRKLIWRRRNEAGVTDAERWAWRERESVLKKQEAQKT